MGYALGYAAGAVPETLDLLLRQRLAEQEMQRRIAEDAAQKEEAARRDELLRQQIETQGRYADIAGAVEARRADAETRQQQALQGLRLRAVGTGGGVGMPMGLGAVSEIGRKMTERPELAEYADMAEAGVPVTPYDPMLPQKQQSAAQLQEERIAGQFALQDAKNEAMLAALAARGNQGDVLSRAQAVVAARTIANEFENHPDVKSYRAMRRTNQIMKTGLNRILSGRARDLNASSQAILVTFQKALDDDSVVRESEYLRSTQGLALVDQIRGRISALLNAGPGVPPDALAEFVALAGDILKRMQPSMAAQRTKTSNLIKFAGIPEDIVLSPEPDPFAPEIGEIRQIQPNVWAEWDGKGWKPFQPKLPGLRR